LRALLSRYAYLTRVYTRISPQDMTIDPVFKFNTALPDVSNVHDLSRDPNRVWDCNTMQNKYVAPTPVAAVTQAVIAQATAVATRAAQATAQATDNFNAVIIAIYVAGGAVTLALVFVGVALWRRRV
jgi:hypothetical protein